MAIWDPPHIIHIVKLCPHANVLGCFLAKVQFLALKNIYIQKGVWPYRYTYDSPLVTLILNIYDFVGLAPFCSGKVPSFNIEGGVAI